MAQVPFFGALVFLFFFQLDLLQCYNLKLQTPIISPECKLVGICDNVENYPRELVKELIDKLKSQNMIFNYDEAPQPKLFSRFNDFDEQPLSLCETTPWLVPPESAIDMNGNWQFIINDPAEPVQVFRIETCRTPMSRCSENIDFIPGYNGACIQKMVLREMYYVNETEEIDRTYFQVPTCCSCSMIRKEDDK